MRLHPRFFDVEQLFLVDYFLILNLTREKKRDMMQILIVVVGLN